MRIGGRSDSEPNWSGFRPLWARVTTSLLARLSVDPASSRRLLGLPGQGRILPHTGAIEEVSVFVGSSTRECYSPLGLPNLSAVVCNIIFLNPLSKLNEQLVVICPALEVRPLYQGMPLFLVQVIIDACSSAVCKNFFSKFHWHSDEIVSYIA